VPLRDRSSRKFLPGRTFLAHALDPLKIGGAVTCGQDADRSINNSLPIECLCCEKKEKPASTQQMQRAMMDRTKADVANEAFTDSGAGSC
jgi:hypothetical protein